MRATSHRPAARASPSLTRCAERGAGWAHHELVGRTTCCVFRGGACATGCGRHPMHHRSHVQTPRRECALTDAISNGMDWACVAQSEDVRRRARRNVRRPKAARSAFHECARAAACLPLSPRVQGRTQRPSTWERGDEASEREGSLLGDERTQQNVRCCCHVYICRMEGCRL